MEDKDAQDSGDVNLDTTQITEKTSRVEVEDVETVNDVVPDQATVVNQVSNIQSEDKKLGYISIVLSVLGLLSFCSPACCGIFSIIGFIVGILAYKEKATKDLGLIAIVLAIIGFVLGIGSFILGFSVQMIDALN